VGVVETMIITITTSEDTPIVIVEDDSGDLVDTESFDNYHSAYMWAAAQLMDGE
jgi:hypothetical protein